jgi:hypothetical protein
MKSGQNNTEYRERLIHILIYLHFTTKYFQTLIFNISLKANFNFGVPEAFLYSTTFTVTDNKL